MIFLRRSQDRGRADHGWLKSQHTFSFADYYNPQFNGFSCLRVINQDVIAGGTGFPTHGHQNMEIVSYILRGELEHKDSMGTSSVIRPGELQRMSAGTGVRHSEYNASATEECEFLQIWILPNEEGLKPSYEQKAFDFSKSEIKLVAGGSGEASLKIHQDAKIYAAQLKAGAYQLPLSENRAGWLQLIQGEIKMGEYTAKKGDALALMQEEATSFEVMGSEKAHFLFFDLPAYDK
jgi:redox-sensitive bicupin YhaK (pirin superfamily)